jgi:hypothetical protein
MAFSHFQLLSCCRQYAPNVLLDRRYSGYLSGVIVASRIDLHAGAGGVPHLLHRLFVSGSDRVADRRREDYAIAGVEGLDLHHLYRAMAWLGEGLPEKEQDKTGEKNND